MFGYKPINDAIVAILNTVPALQVVYPKEAKTIEKFPGATVSAKEHTSEFHDTVANLKSYSFFVRLYFRTDDTNNPDYESILETTADAVIYALEHDITLGGVVDWSMPTQGVWRNVEKETAVRMLELTVLSKARVIR